MEVALRASLKELAGIRSPATAVAQCFAVCGYSRSIIRKGTSSLRSQAAQDPRIYVRYPALQHLRINQLRHKRARPARFYKAHEGERAAAEPLNG